MPVGDLPDEAIRSSQVSQASPDPLSSPSHEWGISVDLPTPKVALAVGAHPDDIEFGCGGTLAKWAASGCSIHHLVLTDGSKGTWDQSTDIEQLRRIRKEEQSEAARILGGGDVTFLRITDGLLESDMATRKLVCEVIRRVKPDILLGHDPWRRYRLHPDHRHAGWLVTDGLVVAREPTFFPDAGPAHRPDCLLLWEADSPNHVEDVTPFFTTKLDALMAHRSQHLSTMGIGTGGVGADEGEKTDDVIASESAAFAERVHKQLASHGSLGGVALGEAFHLIDRT
ncbi:MAG: PIG-L deacetylase family protein [Acidimicrobiales bacterium]